MGIGRRSFIKLSSLVLAGTMIDPFQAVATNNQYYVNKKFGIIFEIPKNWGFVKIKDFGKIKEEQILDGYYDLIKEKIYDDLGDPICIATKYFDDNPKHKGMFSPTITLNVTPISEIKELGISNMTQLFEESLAGVKKILKNFKVVKLHEPYKICDYLIFERDSTYSFEHQELNNSIQVELKAFKIVHNHLLYEFNCHQSKEVNQIAQVEFEAFKETIKLI